MFKRLSVLTRLFVFLLAGTALLALGVAQFDSSQSSRGSHTQFAVGYAQPRSLVAL